MTALLPVLFSFVGAVLVLCMPAARPNFVRATALLTSVLGLLAALQLMVFHDPNDPGFQQVFSQTWIHEVGISFSTGVDGISVVLVLLTGIVAVCGVLFSWGISYRIKEFFALYLVLIAGVYGVFISTDLFLLFVFYEIAIVPKYFLIAIWGSTRREYAAMKLVLFSFASSAVALFGLLALGLGAEQATFSLTELMRPGVFDADFQIALFPALFLGFAVLAGMWPFHTWAPTGHVAAPTAASMLLAGVVMKLGAYGCLRVAMGVLPIGAQFWAPFVAVLGVVGIVYGALAALRQDDFKFVIGYSSVSHMGFVILGLATLDAVGLSGAVLQMFSHGVIGALLFAIVGTMVYERTHTRQLADFDRLIDRMPPIAWLFIVAGLASMGLPGFSGFVAELHILIGVWRQPDLSGWFLVGAGFGVFATFAYTLVKVHEAFFRKRQTPGAGHDPEKYPGPMWYETAGCALLIGASLLMGIAPGLFTRLIDPSLAPLVRLLNN